MNTFSRLAIIAGLAVGATLAVSTAASAANLMGSSGTVLQLTPSASSTQSFNVGTADGGGYYYTFTTNKAYKIQFSEAGSLNADTVINPFVIETGATPGGTVLGSSVDGVFASGLTIPNLAAGTYNLYIASTTPSEAIGGSASVAAVPEPAAWSLMMLGIGGIGLGLRRARTAARALAQA